MKFVLDASAVLAYVHQESGWNAVQAVIENACISAVNWSEILQKTAQKGLDSDLAGTLLQERGLAIQPFSARQAELAASLWASTRDHGLSLADRACLALALDRKLPVLTADKAWSGLKLDIAVELCR